MLAELRGRCRPEDLASALDLPLQDAARALRAFARRYRCRVEVVGGGAGLRYAFDLPLRRRPGYDSLFAAIADGVRALARGVYGMGLGLTITVYGGVFVLAAIAATSGTDPKLRSNLRRAVWDPSWGWSRLKGFARRVQEFALGPARSTSDPASMLQAIYAFLSHNAGVLTTTDVQALTGCERGEADRFLTWLMTVDNADLHVDEGGHLLYVFGEFRRVGRNDRAPPPWVWADEPEQWSVTRLGAANADVQLFAAVSLLGALGLELLGVQAGWPSGFLRVILADVPLLVSLVALSFPFARFVTSVSRRNRAVERVLRIEILRVIEEQGRPFDLVEDVDVVCRRYANLERRALLDVLGGAVRALPGELTPVPDGHQAVDCPLARAERRLSILARDRVLAGLDPPGLRAGA